MGTATISLGLAVAMLASTTDMVSVTGNEFNTRPPSAVARTERGCATARQFARLLATGRQEQIHTLFAPRAIWLTPGPAILHSAAEVKDFIPKVQAQIAAFGPIEEIPFSVLGGGNDCFVELAVKTAAQAKFRLTAIHHITTRADGKIIQLISYVRPGAMPGD